MMLWMLMFGLAVASIFLEAVLIHLLNAKIPSLFSQREEGEKIIGGRAFRDISMVKNDFEAYFEEVRRMLNRVVILYIALTIAISLLFSGLIYSIPISLPTPGLLTVPKFVVAAFLTLIITSYGWLKIVVDYCGSRMMRRELVDKYVILGAFESSD